MNKAESAALELILAERGWESTIQPETADMVIINTCSVRLTAENRAWGRIAHYAALKRQHSFILVVTGCMAERLKKKMLEKQPQIDYVLGNFQKQAFALVVDAAADGRIIPDIEESPQFTFAASHYEKGAFKAFVPIMHGCNNFCSYCIVPYVRGREISRNPLAILLEILQMAEQGVREVELLGQNVNSYNWLDGISIPADYPLDNPLAAKAQVQLVALLDCGAMDFPSLLAWLAEILGGSSIGRIRFVSSHPKDLSERTIDVLAKYPIFARHIHLCVQHGSNRILQAMNRKYTVEKYLELVNALRKKIPEITLSTDILIGFPGETEEDVQATLQLLETVRFAYAYMYYFNPREGTPAAEMDTQLSMVDKKQRLARIISVQRAISQTVMQERVGQTVQILAEGLSRKSSSELLGRTEQDMMVVCKGDSSLIGSFINVKLETLRGTTFKARLVED